MTDLHTRTFCIASWPSESAGQRQAHPWAERQREPAYTAVVRAQKFRRLRIVKKQGHLLGGLVCIMPSEDVAFDPGDMRPNLLRCTTGQFSGYSRLHN